MNFKWHKNVVYGTSIFCFGISICLSFNLNIMSFAFDLKEMKPLSWSLCSAFLDIIKITFVLQFVFAVSTIRVRFKHLNKYLRTKRRSDTSLMTTNLILFKVTTVYHKLCDSIEVLNNTFTFHFVFILLNALVRKLIN